MKRLESKQMKTVSCPNCNAPMTYDPQDHAWHCSYCGTESKPSAHRSISSFARGTGKTVKAAAGTLSAMWLLILLWYNIDSWGDEWLETLFLSVILAVPSVVILWFCLKKKDK